MLENSKLELHDIPMELVRPCEQELGVSGGGGGGGWLNRRRLTKESATPDSVTRSRRESKVGRSRLSPGIIQPRATTGKHQFEPRYEPKLTPA